MRPGMEFNTINCLFLLQNGRFQIPDCSPSEEDKLCRHPCLPNKSKLFTPTKSAHSSRRTGRKIFCCFPPIPLLPTQRKRGPKKGRFFRHPSQINLKHGKKKNPKISPVCMMVHTMMRWWEEVFMWSRERESFGEWQNLLEPWLACLNSNSDCTPQHLMPFKTWWT